jgi:hypothetical protein
MAQGPDRGSVSGWFGPAAWATAACAGCGHQAPLASSPFSQDDGLQVSCLSCGAVLIEIRVSPHATWLDVRGIRRDPPDPPGQTWVDL